MGRNFILLWGLWRRTGSRWILQSLTVISTDWSPFPVHVIVILKKALLPSGPGKHLFSQFSPDRRWCGWSPAWWQCPLSPPLCISLPSPCERPALASSLCQGQGSTGTHTDQQPGCPLEWVPPSTPIINSNTNTLIRQLVNQWPWEMFYYWH